MSQSTSPLPYGRLDASYRAAGGSEGIRRLVDCFYQFMDQLPEAKVIRAMHDQDLSRAREKLTVFLIGWLGGPREYTRQFGPISIPQVHRHLVINEPERDAWLLCMHKAVELQPYKQAFKQYLMQQLRVPAERVRVTSQS